MDVCFDEIIYNNICFLLRLSNLFDLKHLHMTNMQKNQQKNERNQEKGKYVFFSTVAEFISRCYVAKTDTHTYHLASLEKNYIIMDTFILFSPAVKTALFYFVLLFSGFFFDWPKAEPIHLFRGSSFFPLVSKILFFQSLPKIYDHN